MSGFSGLTNGGLGGTIRAAGLLATTTPYEQPRPRLPAPPFERPIRPDRAGQRTVGFWLIATLATLGAVAALSAYLLAHQLATRADQQIAGFIRLARSPATPRSTAANLDENCLVLALDADGRVVERHRGSTGLPAFPTIDPARLKTYAARTHPSAFGDDYRAQVVPAHRNAPDDPARYLLIARSTVDDRLAVERLLQVESVAALPLLAGVLFGARRLGRREVRAREESERRLREFMASAGHELRNPLTTISGYAELARVGDGDPAYEPMRQEALGRISTEVGRMSTLIDELVLLTRLDLGQPLQLTTVDLARLCRDAATAARDCNPDHPVRVLIAPGDHTVIGDPLRLHQLVANLLTNARVHTPAGTTTTLGLGTEDGHRVIEVMDDGPGIPRELHARLFDPFVRGEETRAAGSGLGLSIVTAIATAHGGRVTLEPSHRGAWFRVRLPAPA
ncbi:sensor histidine kinase [Streptomyces ipomoeae]|uniref:sensor histidine kinase n=1 Tax=Streptomyces ipomoeae TaxID=103232 RepID=UPI0011468EA9|nr:HAMP domain-containing sensor histidine kinase [Streptomyces ipomoeae]MDX2932377.1 HAMP domain-containing sensor histidine kinase [Streptomyces ipomoeae]TQE27068.1 HAMP domain-containing histidine kinase [Streptomyces ipomoeae]